MTHPPGAPSPGRATQRQPCHSLGRRRARLYFAQCFHFGGPQWDLRIRNFNECNPDGSLRHYRLRVQWSNAFDIRNWSLDSPRLFEGRVVKIDLLADNAAVADVAAGMVAPNAVKFNSRGELHIGDTGASSVYRIDLDNPDLGNNRRVVVAKDTLPFDNIDNLSSF